MTRIAYDPTGDAVYVEHGGKTVRIGSGGRASTDPYATVDNRNFKLVFDNTHPNTELPRPENGEHIWIERADADGNDPRYTDRFRTGTVVESSSGGEGLWLTLVTEDGNRDGGTWWATENRPRDFTRVVAWGLVEPERTLVWPKGTPVLHWNFPNDVHTRFTTEDYYEGDTIVYYEHRFGSETCSDRTAPSNLERVYVVGDTLPAGTPMPANGVYDLNGERDYCHKGSQWHGGAKIIWLEAN